MDRTSGFALLAMLATALLTGCGSGGSSANGNAGLFDPVISFVPNGNGWSANPVKDDLGSVSNNGFGYTGEIDRYELNVPVDGQLKIALVWEHQADFDLIVSSDALGTERLVVGADGSNLSEYVCLEVKKDQQLYLIVAGWDGQPGDYSIETILLPPDVPLFAIEELPDLSIDPPRNMPVTLRFNQELDPAQDAGGHAFLIATGHLAQGTWCIDGHLLHFLPRLPEGPGDVGGLQEGLVYTLQIPRGPTGLRALNGEYLDEMVTVELEFGPYLDDQPDDPPRVTDIDWNVADQWTGAPIHLTILGALDADSLVMSLHEVGPGQVETPLTFRFTLSQSWECHGSHLTRIRIESLGPPPPAALLRLRIPGTVRGIDGNPAPDQGLTGAVPAPGGQGFELDLRTP